MHPVAAANISQALVGWRDWRPPQTHPRRPWIGPAMRRVWAVFTRPASARQTAIAGQRGS
jgi:hypothetical protein